MRVSKLAGAAAEPPPPANRPLWFHQKGYARFVRQARRASYRILPVQITLNARIVFYKRSGMVSARSRSRSDAAAESEHFAAELESATRGFLDVNVAVLEQMEKRIDLAALRALQSLERLGPSLVTELGDDLGLLPSTASRLSDRLADAGWITRRVSPTNRRATLLQLTASGRAVLRELLVLRRKALKSVAAQMSDDDRAALLQGTSAFTVARQRLSDQGLC
jgi:DNA-binding MarR family transcriptional regulator